MLRDFRTFDGASAIECDVCIAGAGAAGIAMALALRGRGQRVVLLESGGLDFEPEVQALYTGRNVGLPYHELDVARLRFFGGSTNHWGGMCTRLDPIDFTARPWVPESGWPITFADLEPWYARAHPLLEIGVPDYDPAAVSPLGTTYLDLDPERLAAKMWRYSVPPTNFGQRYRDQLAVATDVDVLLHANLVEIETDPAAATVSAVRIANLAGRHARVRARVYVLALGGLENPRLLLASNRVDAAGLGNRRDLVGRYFMEHPSVVAGTVLSLRGEWYKSYSELVRAGQQVRSGIRPSPAAQRRHGVLNTMAMLGELSLVRWLSEGYGSLYVLKKHLLRGELPDRLGHHLWNILSDLDGIVRGVAEKVDLATYIVVEGEQAPNPDSRVRLGAERDALGLPRIEVDWRLLPIDRRTIATLAELLGQEIGRLGVGRVRIAEWLADGDDTTWPDDLIGAFHHMGTTRMADHPARGVVDADCKVFGIDNLYVAGSSVFPTGGCANPTLTLVALALRLADHIRTPVAAAQHTPAIAG